MNATQEYLLLADGRNIPIYIRQSSRARRILLQVGPYDRKVEVVIPAGVSASEGLKFARSQARWVAGRLSHICEKVPFIDGSTFPLLDQPVTIKQTDNRSAIPILLKNELLVGGQSDTISGRVRRWLCDRAAKEIKPRVIAMSELLGRKPARISMRDTRTRWGSCSSAGNLNFSWRLVMAPESVLDYVVAHEVAHLRELNHGSRFWTLVDTLCEDVTNARAWLRVNGAHLHRYGR